MPNFFESDPDLTYCNLNVVDFGQVRARCFEQTLMYDDLRIRESQEYLQKRKHL